MWNRLKWTAYLAWEMRAQGRLPFAPPEALRRIQNRRVRAMVAHAYATVPYYRQTMDRLGLRTEDFRTADDLARLPMIDPQQLQREPELFLSGKFPPDQCVRVQTGGSTGDPRTVYHSTDAVFANAAHGERERSVLIPLIGRRFGYRETIIISLNCTAMKLHAVSRHKAILPSPLRIRRQYISLLDPPEKNVPLINEFRPDVIHTYGSYLGILFPYLAETGREFHRPKGVTFGSDGIADSVRRLIQERFGIPVFSLYQANEALKLGFECERHTGLHLNVDLYPLRVVDSDGRDMPEGQIGDVVISNLVNPATVLLNYRLGDLAALLPQRCDCGRSLPLLSFPPGRSDDLIVLSSGRVVHPQAVRTVFTEEDDVWQYQIVQDSPTGFMVKVIVAQGVDRQALRQRVETKFAERFGKDVKVDLAFVDTIDRTWAGKFRPVISWRQGGVGPGRCGPGREDGSD